MKREVHIGRRKRTCVAINGGMRELSCPIDTLVCVVCKLAEEDQV